MIPVKPYADHKFWSKVTQAGDDPVESCWEWGGYVATTGYGHMRREAKGWLCHRYAYTILRADIPEGLHLDHLCRNRKCVNPWHLEPVTPRVNIQRVIREPRPTRTHCAKGHEFDGLRTRDGFQRCRTCLNAAKRAFLVREREKAAA